LQKPDENLRPFNHTIEIVASGRSALPQRRSFETVTGNADTTVQDDPQSPVPAGDLRLVESAASKLVTSLMPHEPPPQLEVLQQWSGSASIATATRACN